MTQRPTVMDILHASPPLPPGNFSTEPTDEQEEAEMDKLPDELRCRTLCEQTSEMWLWHGTKPSLIETLIKFGLE